MTLKVKFWHFLTARHYSNSPNLVISFDYSWFLAKYLSNFVYLSWKLHNRYCHRPSVGITRKYEFGSAVLLMISRSEKNFWARKFASDIALGFWASEQTWNSLLRYSKGLSFDDTEYWWMSCDFLKIFNSLWIRLAWCKSKNVTVQRYYSLTIFKVFCLLLYWIYN